MAKVYQNTNPVLNWDEDRYYARSSRLSMIIALLLVLAAFLILPKDFSVKPYSLKKNIDEMLVDIPLELDNIVEPPQVERPKLPVAASNPTEVEKATVEPFIFHEITRKAEITDIPVVEYWKVEIPPTSINIPQPKYPELARLAGIEGTVFVKALVDIDGKIMATEILKSSGNTTLDEAALEAAKYAVFTPAKQQDMFVRVWVSIPYKFKLNSK